MDSSDEISIARDKFMTVIMALGAGAFVAVGVWIVYNANDIATFRSAYAFWAGLAGIVFFGLVFIFTIKKLFEHGPGLVINSKGILDTSSGNALCFVPWEEIVTFSTKTVMDQKFLAVIVKDPGRYINRGALLRRLISRANQSMYGSPIQISAKLLRIEFDELESILREYLRKYGSSDK